MPNGMYGGGRGRKTKVGRKLLLFSSYSIKDKLVTKSESFLKGVDCSYYFAE